MLTNEGQIAGHKLFRRGEKEAERASSGPFGVEPLSLGLPVPAKMMLTAITFVAFLFRRGRMI